MEFNQGKPLTEASIAGEKGAIFDTDSIALKFAYFDGAKGVWDSSPVGILEKSRGDRFDNRILSTCRWATLADLTAAGLTEAEALPMLHESQRPFFDGWGPWIEWKGGECPIPHAQFGDFELKFADGGGYPEFDSGSKCKSLHFSAAYFRECWKHIGAATGHRKITAYRVRLTAQQAEPCKAKASDFEVVRWPDLPETESDRDTDIGDGVDERERMVQRDEPTKTAQQATADPIEALWQAIGAYSVQVSETGECAPPAELVAAFEAIQKALTPPAPPKPEPKTADFSMLAPMERLGATRWGV